MSNKKIIIFNAIPTVLSLFHMLGGLPYPWVLLYHAYFGLIPMMAFLLGGIYCVLINSCLFKLSLRKNFAISAICITLNVLIYAMVCVFLESFDATIFALLAIPQYLILLISIVILWVIREQKVSR